VLTTCSSIASSRKRKLRELFAIAAADRDGIPNFDLSDPDAPPTAPAEEKFLNEADILQYVTLSQYTVFIPFSLLS
jgi:chromatin modification-related protein VID21